MGKSRIGAWDHFIIVAGCRIECHRHILFCHLRKVGLRTYDQKKRCLAYGELAEEASKIPVPTDVKLKDRKDFKFIGKEIKNVANNDIVT